MGLGLARAFLTLSLIYFLAIASSTAQAQTFRCTSSGRKCNALIDFWPRSNATTLSAIKTLFGLKNLRSLLGANNFPLSTASNRTVPAQQTIKIPFPCICTNGTGISNRRPIYTVVSGDSLSHIAEDVFSGLVTFQQIQNVNNIPDPNLINVDQSLWIPLPCSCDDVNEQRVVHYGHRVATGSTVAGIAQQYNTSVETLLGLNGLASTNDLKADVPLDVPLQACTSMVGNTSEDYPLLVSNGTYVFTATNCVMCNCDAANNWILQCQPSYINSSCAAIQCQGTESLYLGNTTTTGCNRTTCAYAGYINHAINTTLATESTCPEAETDSQMVMEGGGRKAQEEKGNMENSTESDVVGELMEVFETVGSFVSFTRTQRKECLNLVRRLKLLVPLLEEIRELNTPIPVKALHFLTNLKKPLVSANKLLKHCNNGSKIYLAYDSEAVTCRFHGVYDKLNQALDDHDIPYEELGISQEVKEQVELMRMQLKRAKRRTETQDIELAMDIMVVFSKNNDRNADSAIIERLAKKLDLHTIADLKTETVAVRKLVKDTSGQNAESSQKIIDLLGKFKQIAGIEQTDVLDVPMSSRSLKKCQSLFIPHEFLCPIALEIMTDPVIVATGQTYERESIKKWLDSNHRTCPKTGQTLSHLSLAPNFSLRNLILQWCEKNNFELPRKETYAGFDSFSTELIEEVSFLVQNLLSCQLDVQKEAIVKIRMLSKENPENRILIARCGGIPPLIQLMSYPDSKTQEYTVTALLNLSIDETNKILIAREGAIPAIIEVLKNGTDEARENSAAALFSLSMLDENKVMVGYLNGIPPLVDLLRTGTIRGKKDAATALFNLSLNQVNKSRAIKVGIIPPLLHLVEDNTLGMIDEALSILLLLASHPEGQNEIGRLTFIETLVYIIRDGTPKNKECATAVLLVLGLNNSSFVLAALQYGVYDHLIEISRCGTSRAQRKANSLLQHMTKCEHIL